MYDKEKKRMDLQVNKKGKSHLFGYLGKGFYQRNSRQFSDSGCPLRGLPHRASPHRVLLLHSSWGPAQLLSSHSVLISILLQGSKIAEKRPIKVSRPAEVKSSSLPGLQAP